MLTQRGYRVICAGAKPARTLLEADRASVQLLITNKPLEFAAFSDLPVVYLAASPDPAALVPFVYCRALAKPFHPRRLMECVAQLLP